MKFFFKLKQKKNNRHLFIYLKNDFNFNSILKTF